MKKTGKKAILKKALFLALTTLFVCLTAYGLRLRLEQRRLADSLIRLHVVASSDSAADQAKKLEVRDAVLPVIEALTRDCASAGEAEAKLKAGFPDLRAAAAAALGAEGGSELKITLEKESFPRREYPTFSLPAGTYRALRIVIGAGEGHNWWCVAFPALCLPAAEEDFSQAAREAGLTDDQVDLMTSDTPAVRLKFRVLDWLAALFG